MSEFEPDYQNFGGFVEGRIKDKLPLDQETVATLQEVGWWKQFQFKRALRHLRRGEATLVEQRYLQNKGKIIPCRAARLRVKGKE